LSGHGNYINLCLRRKLVQKLSMLSGGLSRSDLICLVIFDKAAAVYMCRYRHRFFRPVIIKNKTGLHTGCSPVFHTDDLLTCIINCNRSKHKIMAYTFSFF
jgi:hypothetical protein